MTTAELNKMKENARNNNHCYIVGYWEIGEVETADFAEFPSLEEGMQEYENWCCDGYDRVILRDKNGVKKADSECDEDFGESSLRRQEAMGAYMYANGNLDGFYEDDAMCGGRW